MTFYSEAEFWRFVAIFMAGLLLGIIFGGGVVIGV